MNETERMAILQGINSLDTKEDMKKMIGSLMKLSQLSIINEFIDKIGYSPTKEKIGIFESIFRKKIFPHVKVTKI